jgi:heat shock protein HslJ
VFNKKLFLFSLLLVLLTDLLIAKDKNNRFNGDWHLRVLDGMEVRKARAILDFNMHSMKLAGFDGCNRIGGIIQKNTKTNMNIPQLKATHMACRRPIHRWVSTRLHEVLQDGFYIKEEKRYGVHGITIKSHNHELFLKKMGREKKSN